MPVQLLAIFKFLASFLKRSWRVTDYPVRITRQNESGNTLPKNYTLVPWIVEIINWWQVFGTGATKQAALDGLQHKLDLYKQEHGRLPRPGIRVPLKFATTMEIDHFKNIARDYFRRVLNRDFDRCFISDRSSVLDFPGNEDYIEETQRLYGVDISDISDGNFVRIFKRLQEI
jgi:hypothetical protein